MAPPEETLDMGRFSTLTACPACASTNISPRGVKPTIHPNGTSRFTIVFCGNCGHWATNPMPQQDYLLQLYREGSLSVFGEGWEEVVGDQFESKPHSGLLGKNAWIVDAERNREPGNYLEIGPGNGAVLRSYERMNWQCYSIEPGSWSKDRPRVYDSISQLPDLRFDVVVANNVLEHVSDPRKMLGEICSVLKPGGRFYACFPRADSFRARIQGINWRMVRPIGHLHYFSTASVKELLSACNLSLTRMSSYDVLFDMDGLRTVLAQSLAALRIMSVFKIAVDGMVSAVAGALGAGDQWRIEATRDGE